MRNPHPLPCSLHPRRTKGHPPPPNLSCLSLGTKSFPLGIPPKMDIYYNGVGPCSPSPPSPPFSYILRPRGTLEYVPPSTWVKTTCHHSNNYFLLCNIMTMRIIGIYYFCLLTLCPTTLFHISILSMIYPLLPHLPLSKLACSMRILLHIPTSRMVPLIQTFFSEQTFNSDQDIMELMTFLDYPLDFLHHQSYIFSQVIKPSLPPSKQIHN